MGSLRHVRTPLSCKFVPESQTAPPNPRAYPTLKLKNYFRILSESFTFISRCSLRIKIIHQIVKQLSMLNRYVKLQFSFLQKLIELSNSHWTNIPARSTQNSKVIYLNVGSAFYQQDFQWDWTGKSGSSTHTTGKQRR